MPGKALCPVRDGAAVDTHEPPRSDVAAKVSASGALITATRSWLPSVQPVVV
jgi:hypothetical protein